MKSEQNITALIVTYNRRPLLERCLNALAKQTLVPDQILIVDNASTDNTREWLKGWLPIHLPSAKLLLLQDNLGGAGGFSTGLKTAIGDGADWVWMMDDDAEPHPRALTELMQITSNPLNIYGSLATHGNETSWLMTLQEASKTSRNTYRVEDIPPQARVQMLPFLGFTIHRNLVKKIGFPDPGFFIAADDVEYCLRAQKAGSEIIVAGKSHIEHPKSRPYEVKLPGYTLTCLSLPPWKRYYDTRNRLLIARKHYGAKLFTHTIPGSFIRMTAALVKEDNRPAQLKAFLAGFIDGLIGRKGRRHDRWRIK